MKALRALLFSESRRVLPHARAWNIALRTAHIAVSGALFGGHVFDVNPQRLMVWLYLTIFTGAVLLAIEAYPSRCWWFEGRGVLVLSKLLLLGSIPWLWEYRVPILIAVIVIASVGSHMPARFRYYSVWHGRVLNESPAAEHQRDGQSDGTDAAGSKEDSRSASSLTPDDRTI